MTVPLKIHIILQINHGFPFYKLSKCCFFSGKCWRGGNPEKIQKNVKKKRHGQTNTLNKKVKTYKAALLCLERLYEEFFSINVTNFECLFFLTSGFFKEFAKSH